jgi:hypothetical protein
MNNKPKKLDIDLDEEDSSSPVDSDAPSAIGRNILDSVYELADILKQDPSSLDKALLKKGEELVSVFSDATYNTRRFPDLNMKKIEVLEKAIDDVAMGVLILRSSVIGLMNKGGKIIPYVNPHGSNPDGDVVFNIKWKNIVAFKSWRKEDGTEDVSQDDVNASIYKLTVDISKYMD